MIVEEDLAPAPSTNSVSASSGYLAAAADALPISSVPAAATVDTRVEEPATGYRSVFEYGRKRYLSTT